MKKRKYGLGGDIGKYMLNNLEVSTLGTIGLDLYKPKFDTSIMQGVNDVSQKVIGVGQKGMQMAANIAVPGLGTAVGAVQGIGKNIQFKKGGRMNYGTMPINPGDLDKVTGNTLQYDGNAHSDGGIPLQNGAELEKNETVIKPGAIGNENPYALSPNIVITEEAARMFGLSKSDIGKSIADVSRTIEARKPKSQEKMAVKTNELNKKFALDKLMKANEYLAHKLQAENGINSESELMQSQMQYGGEMGGYHSKQIMVEGKPTWVRTDEAGNVFHVNPVDTTPIQDNSLIPKTTSYDLSSPWNLKTNVSPSANINVGETYFNKLSKPTEQVFLGNGLRNKPLSYQINTPNTTQPYVQPKDIRGKNGEGYENWRINPDRIGTGIGDLPDLSTIPRINGLVSEDLYGANIVNQGNTPTVPNRPPNERFINTPSQYVGGNGDSSSIPYLQGRNNPAQNIGRVNITTPREIPMINQNPMNVQSTTGENIPIRPYQTLLNSLGKPKFNLDKNVLPDDFKDYWRDKYPQEDWSDPDFSKITPKLWNKPGVQADYMNWLDKKTSSFNEPSKTYLPDNGISPVKPYESPLNPYGSNFQPASTDIRQPRLGNFMQDEPVSKLDYFKKLNEGMTGIGSKIGEFGKNSANVGLALKGAALLGELATIGGKPKNIPAQYNPYKSQIIDNANLRMDNSAIKNDIASSLNTALNSSSGRSWASQRALNAQMMGNASDAQSKANLQSQEANNRYKEQLSQTYNNLGQQDVAARNQAEVLNAQTQAAWKQGIRAGIGNIGNQGADALIKHQYVQDARKDGANLNMMQAKLLVDKWSGTFGGIDNELIKLVMQAYPDQFKTEEEAKQYFSKITKK